MKARIDGNIRMAITQKIKMARPERLIDFLTSAPASQTTPEHIANTTAKAAIIAIIPSNEPLSRLV
jgi:hypothetical protein